MSDGTSDTNEESFLLSLYVSARTSSYGELERNNGVQPAAGVLVGCCVTLLLGKCPLHIFQSISEVVEVAFFHMVNNIIATTI